MANILMTGCGSGFGAFCALKLANLGHDVIASVRDLSRVKEPALINTGSGSLQYIQMDVTNRSEINNVLINLNELNKIPDIVILNAGSYAAGTIESADEELVRRSFEVNYWGGVNVVRSVLPMMRENRNGKIIGIGSISASVGLPCDGYYSASKAAMARMLESLRYEVIPFGIHVSLVSPASFNSGLFKELNCNFSMEDPYYPLLNHWLKDLHENSKSISLEEISDVVLTIINDPLPEFLFSVGSLARQVLDKLKLMNDQERSKAIVDWSDTSWWVNKNGDI